METLFVVLGVLTVIFLICVGDTFLYNMHQNNVRDLYEVRRLLGVVQAAADHSHGAYALATHPHLPKDMPHEHAWSGPVNDPGGHHHHFDTHAEGDSYWRCPCGEPGPLATARTEATPINVG